MGAPRGGWGADCEGGNEQRSASRPQSDRTGGRGKNTTRWRHSRDRTRPGVWGECNCPRIKINAATPHKEPCGGARHSIRYAKPRGLRPGPLRFCITHVMLQRAAFTPGRHSMGLVLVGRAVAPLNAGCKWHAKYLIGSMLHLKARCSSSRCRSRAGGLRVPASRMTGVLICGGERRARC